PGRDRERLTLVYLLVIVAAVLVIAAIAYSTQRKSRDGVASFKRQIDALSPQARKPVVDQVQSVSDLRRSSDHGKAEPDTDADVPSADASSTSATGDETDNETGDETVDDVPSAEPTDEPEDPADGA
ncbi:MAG TPA: hypothetical protein VMM60_12130, partial [Ilumatobacter sp.]|nr:hypothetical protein [Ilumatobacter sp.]